jgi:hypothetical protein
MMPIASRSLSRSPRLIDAGGAPAATTSERYELKYWATEEQARALATWAAPQLLPDPYAAVAGPRGSWNVSLYLDTSGLLFFERHLAGMPDRLKLRVRTYPPARGVAPGPQRAFLEIKRRVNAVMLKQRVGVPRADAIALISGLGPMPRGLSVADQRDVEAFLYLRGRHQARPVMLVRARRQAFFGRDPGALRVTFDRDMECLPTRDWVLDGPRSAWMPIVRPAAVLVELKFRDAAPGWLAAMVETLDLPRTAYSKYVAAIGQEIRAPRQAWRPWDEEN